jgi:hypothetical protein
MLARLLTRGVGGTTRRGAANKGKNRLAGDLDDDVVKETKSDVAQMRKALGARVDEAEDIKKGAELRRRSVQEAGGRAMLRTGSRAGAVAGAGLAGYGAGRAMMDDEEDSAPKRVSVAPRTMDEDKPAPRKEEAKKEEPKKADMTFKEAFAAARKDDKATFTWQGKRYTTEMAKPKSAKVDEGQHENISDDTRERARASVGLAKGGSVPTIYAGVKGPKKPMLARASSMKTKAIAPKKLAYGGAVKGKKK